MRRPHYADKRVGRGKRGAVVVVVAALAIALATETSFAFIPRPYSVSFRLVPKGGALDNITISCYGCVPLVKDRWEGSLILGNISVAGRLVDIPLKVSDNGSGSVGVTIEVPIGNDVPNCQGLVIGNQCVVPLKDIPLPFSVTFDIRKTSNGGNLKAILYLASGSSVIFQKSGNDCLDPWNLLCE